MPRNENRRLGGFKKPNSEVNKKYKLILIYEDYIELIDETKIEELKELKPIKGFWLLLRGNSIYTVENSPPNFEKVLIRQGKRISTDMLFISTRQVS